MGLGVAGRRMGDFPKGALREGARLKDPCASPFVGAGTKDAFFPGHPSHP